MLIRNAQESDVEALVAVYTSAIHEIAASTYSTEERQAWAPIPPDIEAWRARFEDPITLVACDAEEVAGFISYRSHGHIDLLFTAPRYSRQGVATSLYNSALEHLNSLSVRKLTTESSLEARSFFQRQGFQVLTEEVMQRNGVALRRFRMERHLALRK